jgi:hypothetical protein
VVLRKVTELEMRNNYDQMDELRAMVRCLPALAYVREEDVVDSFELPEESMPQHDRMPVLLSYLRTHVYTYVRGHRQRRRRNNYASALFPTDTWNKYKDVDCGWARTNAVEGWHHALQYLFSCHHHTI